MSRLVGAGLAGGAIVSPAKLLVFIIKLRHQVSLVKLVKKPGEMTNRQGTTYAILFLPA